MLEAALWGLVGGFALVVGALIGLGKRATQRVVAMVMAFGAGVLISALAFDLTHEAYTRGGADAVALGLAAGALSYYLANRALDGRGGKDRKRSGGQQSEGQPQAIVIGAVMDGIPESVAIGLTLLEGKGVGIAVVAAVFMSNVPESMSASMGMKKAGHSRAYVLGLWAAVMAVSGLAAMAGYAFLGDASDNVVAGIQAFAAGAILTMLADTMMPEAFEDSDRDNAIGLLTVLGFAAAFLLSTLD